MSKILTIAIPNYNGGERLRRAILSCHYIKLNPEEFEILIVDNHSTDDSVKIINSLKKEFNNIRLIINEKNIGRVENWNRCLDLIDGKYFLFLFSSDEIAQNNYIEEGIDFLEKNNDISLVMGDALFNYPEKKTISPNYGKSFTVNIEDYIKKTFIGLKDFCSLFILQQQIFCTKVVKDNKIKFCSDHPRTADRVFIFEVIKNGNGYFFYLPKVFIVWNLEKERFHNKVHNSSQKDLDILWGDEFWADNYILSKIGINKKNIYINFISYFLLEELSVLKNFRMKQYKKELSPGYSYFKSKYKEKLKFFDLCLICNNIFRTLLLKFKIKINRDKFYQSYFRV